MNMKILMKNRRAGDARGKAVISLIAGIAIILAAQFHNCATAVAVEPVPAAPVERQLPETPAAPAAARDDESLARIILFEKKIAGNRIGEAERREIAEQIVRYSRILGIQPELGAALIAKESRFNPRASSRGYKGLGQLGAAAARNNGVKDPFDIEQNVRGTLSYLKQMMDIWEGRPDRIERALASFNSGAGAVRRRGPGVSRKFINGVLKYHAEILALDISTLISEGASVQPKIPAVE